MVGMKRILMNQLNALTKKLGWFEQDWVMYVMCFFLLTRMLYMHNWMFELWKELEGFAIRKRVQDKLMLM